MEEKESSHIVMRDIRLLRAHDACKRYAYRKAFLHSQDPLLTRRGDETFSRDVIISTRVNILALFFST